MHQYKQDQSQGVDQQMTLPSLDLLAGIIATFTTRFGRFHALGINIAALGSRSRPA